LDSKEKKKKRDKKKGRRRRGRKKHADRIRSFHFYSLTDIQIGISKNSRTISSAQLSNVTRDISICSLSLSFSLSRERVVRISEILREELERSKIRERVQKNARHPAIFIATSHNTNYYRAEAGGDGGGGGSQDHDELYLCRVAFELAFRQRHPAKQKPELMHNQWSGIETRSCAARLTTIVTAFLRMSIARSTLDSLSHAVSPITAPLSRLSLARAKSDAQGICLSRAIKRLLGNQWRGIQISEYDRACPVKPVSSRIVALVLMKRELEPAILRASVASKIRSRVTLLSLSILGIMEAPV